MIKQLLVILISISLISACKDEKKELTVKDLASHPVEHPEPDSVSPERLHAIEHYQAYLNKTEFKTHYAEALRRVADLELEVSEEQQRKNEIADEHAREKIMLSSIEHYNTYLRTYAGHEKNDLVYYQLAKAYSLTGDIENSLKSMDAIVNHYPQSRYIDEVQFRRGEILFVWREYSLAEQAYNSITKHPKSPFYEKALYKLGWSQFKQSHYRQALQTYFLLLDIKERERKINQNGIIDTVKNSEKDFIADSLRVLSLSLSYLNGYKTIEELFKGHPKKLYEPLIYKELGNLYSRKERYNDAARTYMAFTYKHPENSLSPEFHSLALKAYIDGKMNDKILPSKILYVKNYDVGTPFWNKQNHGNRNKIRTNLIEHIRDLAQHFHAQARKSKKLKDYKIAVKWYRNYLKSFPKDKNSAYMNFMLAEALYDAHLYKKALNEYEKSAYQYPIHSKSAEAAYAALITYNILIKKAPPTELVSLKQRALNSAIRFSNIFPNDKRAPTVITKTSETLLQVKNYTLASEFARRIIDNKRIKKSSLKQTAWIVHAHAQFELSQYAIAEKAYKIAINHIPKEGKKNILLISQLTDKLAASVYKQAESFKAKGDNKLAAYHFLRIAKVAPSSPIRATAEYDAATLYIQIKDWKAATRILENFRHRFPKRKRYFQGISSKLALAYTQTGQFDKAAREINLLANYAKTPEEKRKLMWDAAKMYEKSGNPLQAVNLYKKYAIKYPTPFSQSIEAYHRVTEYYKNKKNSNMRNKWLRKLIKAEQRGGQQRTDRSRYLAASAAFELAEPTMYSFKKIKLKIPLKKNLRLKKKRMKAAINAYKKVLSYKIAEFTTAATYNMGEIYNHLAQSLMESQRPKGLSEDELEQYDILLEEQAYPFEEKSINIHSSNITRTKQGIYDKWIKKSMKVLASIQPVRYAKKEKIEPYVLITN